MITGAMMKRLIAEASPESEFYYSGEGVNLRVLLHMCQEVYRPEAIYGSSEMLDAVRYEMVVRSNDWSKRPDEFYGIDLKQPSQSTRIDKNILVVAGYLPIGSGFALVYRDTSRSPEGNRITPLTGVEISKAMSDLGRLSSAKEIKIQKLE